MTILTESYSVICDKSQHSICVKSKYDIYKWNVTLTFVVEQLCQDDTITY